MTEIKVLRLGHRPQRDNRLTTHIGLVSRAFGASELILDKKDKKVEESILDVVDRFGGNFGFKVLEDWKNYLKGWEGTIVHLTMYGEKIQDTIEDLKEVNEKYLVIVGSEKVPREVYEYADYNVAVTNQPHSEVAALAILLDRLFCGKELEKEFNGKIEVIPSGNRKIVKEKD